MNKTVYEKGINDTPKGWRDKNEWNKKVYNLWRHRLRNVYSEKLHEERPTYINSTLCLEWHWLSKFAEDIPKIDGYNEERFLNGELELDKDIKSNGQNKEYSLENCIFVTKAENIRQSNKTMDYEFMIGDKNHNFGKKNKWLSNYNVETKSKQVAQYDKDMNLIKIYKSAMEAERETGIYNGNIKNVVNFGKQIVIKKNGIKHTKLVQLKRLVDLFGNIMMR